MFVSLISTFLLSYLLIFLLINYASRLKLIDIPNERSSHTKVTPRGAGIGFGFTFFISLFIFEFSFFIDNSLTFLAIFLVFLIGVLDDHKDASPRIKFYVIFLATILLYFDGIYINTLGEYFGYSIDLWIIALPFTMFAFAGFTNALNLIDGIDGLAASISIIILSSFLYIGVEFNDKLIVLICSTVIISLLSFLFFNWNPAKIFMGDSGSLFLGFVISLVAVASIKYIHPVTVVYLAAIPVLDTLVVMIRRIRKGISPFSPDKTHVHHILLNFFQKKVRKTVFFIGLMQGLFSLVGLMLALNSSILGEGIASTIAFLGFLGITLFFYMIFTGMKKKQKLIEKLALRKSKKKKKDNS